MQVVQLLDSKLLGQISKNRSVQRNNHFKISQKKNFVFAELFTLCAFSGNTSKFWLLFWKSQCFRILILKVIVESLTAWKVSKYGVFSGPFFPIFELNAERYRASPRIQIECGKIRTRKKTFNMIIRSWPSQDTMNLSEWFLCLYPNKSIYK